MLRCTSRRREGTYSTYVALIDKCHGAGLSLNHDTAVFDTTEKCYTMLWGAVIRGTIERDGIEDKGLLLILHCQVLRKFFFNKCTVDKAM